MESRYTMRVADTYREVIKKSLGTQMLSGDRLGILNKLLNPFYFYLLFLFEEICLGNKKKKIEIFEKLFLWMQRFPKFRMRMKYLCY